jgi:hypothetical protein
VGGNPVWQNYIAFYTLHWRDYWVHSWQPYLDWMIGPPDYIAVVKIANWHARVNIITLVILQFSHQAGLNGSPFRRCRSSFHW